MTTRINTQPAVVIQTASMFFVIEDPSQGNLTRKIPLSDLCDGTTIKATSGYFYVDQTALNQLTAVLESVDNSLGVTINGGTPADPVTIINSNSLVAADNTLISTINGFDSNSVTIIDANSLSSALNIMTSSVNGVSSDATIINSVVLTSTANTLEVLVNGEPSGTEPIINTNTMSSSGNLMYATLNDVISTVAAPIINTNTLISSGNTIKSTVNGIETTAANLINSFAFSKPTTNSILGTINGQQSSVTIVSTMVGSYTGNVVAFSANSQGSNSVTVDGSTIKVKDPTVPDLTDISTLDTVLANITSSTKPLIIVTTADEAYQITDEDVVFYNGEDTGLIGLPLASERTHPIFVFNTSPDVIMNVTPLSGSGQTINGVTGVHCTTGNQGFTFYPDGSNWHTTCSDRGFTSPNITITTHTFSGGDATATYSFYSPADNGAYACTIKNNVITMFMTLEIVISGDPSTTLLTYFDVYEVLGASGFGDFSIVSGYSKSRDLIPYTVVGGGGGTAYTSSFYDWFEHVPLTTYISAKTSYVPPVGTYRVNVCLQFFPS